MNIQQAIVLAKQTLHSDTPQIDAEYLLAKLLQKSFTWLKTWPEYQLDEAQQSVYQDWLNRRLLGEPIAYITGEREFWSLRLQTNPSTLIPRPETELLVELALDYLQQFAHAKILDLGTGTGAIALAIASERSMDKIFACDFNQQTVQLAVDNAITNKLEQVNIFQSDWFSAVAEREFDLIVSNPPYIQQGDPHLQRGDLLFEPLSALVADKSGFSDIMTIINQSSAFLRNGAQLMLEHGYTQAAQVRELMQQAGFIQISSRNDLGDHARVTIGTCQKITQ